MANSPAQNPLTIPLPWNEPPQNYASPTPQSQLLRQELKRQLDHPEDIPLIIHGKHLFEGSTENIPLPHDHQRVFARAHKASASHVEKAIQSCLQARHSWAQLPWQQRSAVFLKAAERISGEQRFAVLAATMLAQNKTAEQAEADSICETVDFLRYQAYFAGQIHDLQPQLSAPGEWNHMEARPLEGFVLALAPFNFTAISVNLAVAPALMGCVVLWKPTLEALPASYLCLKILQQCGLPPGVINMVSGDPELIGDCALRHPELSGLHFTGSTQTFRKLWKNVGKRIESYRNYPRIVGETGGKAFVFAHPSAEPQQLISALIRGAFEYQGQKCSAASRAYIPQSLWDIIKEPLIALTSSLQMGAPDDEKTFAAALINRKAWDKVTHYLDIARQQSQYTILCGGGSDSSRGFFVEPTIIQTQEAQSQLMCEEIFGPVLTVLVYPDDQVIETARLCDATSPYALTGAIVARDRIAMHQLSEVLRFSAGNLYINIKPTGAVVGQQPFGGGRASGTNDKAGSILLLQRWVNYRTIKENFLPPNDHLLSSLQPLPAALK